MVAGIVRPIARQQQRQEDGGWSISCGNKYDIIMGTRALEHAQVLLLITVSGYTSGLNYEGRQTD